MVRHIGNLHGRVGCDRGRHGNGIHAQPLHQGVVSAHEEPEREKRERQDEDEKRLQDPDVAPLLIGDMLAMFQRTHASRPKRPLHLEVATHREHGAHGRDDQAGDDQREIDARIGHRRQGDGQPHEGRGDLGKRDAAQDLQEDDGQTGADKRMKSALHQEGPANEAVGSAHEPHDGDLPAAGENGQTDRVVDEDERDEDEQRDERDADVAHVIRNAEQAFDGLLTAVFQAVGRIVGTVADLLEGRIRCDGADHAFNLLRVGQLDIDGGRQRIHAVELLDDLGIRAHGIAEVLHGFVLGREADALDARDAFDGLHDGVDVVLIRIVGNVRRDGNLVLDRVDDVVDDSAANQEYTDDQQRQENRNDRPQRRAEVAGESGQGFLEEIEQTRHRSRTPPCSGRA